MKLWDYIKWLSPARLILVKRVVDALEQLIRLLEQLFDKPNEEDNKK